MTLGRVFAPPEAAPGDVRSYVETAIIVAASVFAGTLIAPRWGTAPVDLLFLPAVISAATLYGRGPAVFAALASALSYNFFFTHPVHTLRIADAGDLVTVIVLFLVALVTSQLAGRMRAEARTAAELSARNATIAGLARHLLSCAGEQDIAEVTCAELARLFRCNAVMLGQQAEPTVIAAYPPAPPLTQSDIAAAASSLRSGHVAGRGAQHMHPADWVFHPVRSHDTVIAVFGFARDDGKRPVADDEAPLLDNLLDQVALALERARLEAQMREVAGLRARDRLRSALLAAISRDLRPSLKVIADGATQIGREGSTDNAAVADLRAEAMKLDRYVSNLLDLGADEDQPVRAGAVTINLRDRRVLKGDVEIHLTPKEFAVLAELAKYPGRVLTHAHLLRTVWGPAQETQADYLRVAIRALRLKLEVDPKRPALIVNEPAVGYRLLS